jgi:hypothetical protein
MASQNLIHMSLSRISYMKNRQSAQYPKMRCHKQTIDMTDSITHFPNSRVRG